MTGDRKVAQRGTAPWINLPPTCTKAVGRSRKGGRWLASLQIALKSG